MLYGPSLFVSAIGGQVKRCLIGKVCQKFVRSVQSVRIVNQFTSVTDREARCCGVILFLVTQLNIDHFYHIYLVLLNNYCLMRTTTRANLDSSYVRRSLIAGIYLIIFITYTSFFKPQLFPKSWNQNDY